MTTTREISKKKAIKKAEYIDDNEVLIDNIIKGLQEKKAKNIVTLNLKNIEARVCDYFVICHAQSTTQVLAIADSVEDYVRKNIKVKPWKKEGFENAEWILIDYFDIVVHIFLQETRDFYKLEELWADAERTEIADVE